MGFSSDNVLLNLTWLLVRIKKDKKTKMQVNRQIIVAKAINLRANKTPLRIAEIIDFSLNSC
jgi:hypothetical protein